eukprot:Ihof_evm2s686 gene=Ihof_evmTU2s686
MGKGRKIKHEQGKKKGLSIGTRANEESKDPVPSAESINKKGGRRPIRGFKEEIDDDMEPMEEHIVDKQLRLGKETTVSHPKRGHEIGDKEDSRGKRKKNSKENERKEIVRDDSEYKQARVKREKEHEDNATNEEKDKAKEEVGKEREGDHIKGGNSMSVDGTEGGEVKGEADREGEGEGEGEIEGVKEEIKRGVEGDDDDWDDIESEKEQKEGEGESEEEGREETDTTHEESLSFQDLFPRSSMPGFSMAGRYGLHIVNSNKYTPILEGLRANDDESKQFQSISELCELLCVGTEDTLTGFPVSFFVSAIATLMNKEHNPDMMLLAVRALTYMMEALPLSTTVIVQHNVVPSLCAKLLNFEYIDLAEQSLTALEKISHSHGSSLLRAGGLSACLSYMDFFATSLQRVSVTIASNICRQVPADMFYMIVDMIPTLHNLLTYPDSKIVERACLSLLRLIDNLQGHPDKLAQLAAGNLIPNLIKVLINYDSVPSPGTFTMIVHMMATLCKGNPALVAVLYDNDVIGLLRGFLGGEEEGQRNVTMNDRSDTTSTGTPIPKPDTEKLFELLSLAVELLPPLPTNGVFATPENARNALMHMEVETEPKEDARQTLITSGSSLVVSCSSLLPVLLNVFSSAACPKAKQKCLETILKIVFHSTSDNLKTLLSPLPISTFVVSLLSSPNMAYRIAGLQLADIIMTKLHDVYADQFNREGVIHEIEQLRDSSTPIGTLHPEIPEVVTGSSWMDNQLNQSESVNNESGKQTRSLTQIFDDDERAMVRKSQRDSSKKELKIEDKAPGEKEAANDEDGNTTLSKRVLTPTVSPPPLSVPSYGAYARSKGRGSKTDLRQPFTLSHHHEVINPSDQLEANRRTTLANLMTILGNNVRSLPISTHSPHPTIEQESHDWLAKQSDLYLSRYFKKTEEGTNGNTSILSALTEIVNLLNNSEKINTNINSNTTMNITKDGKGDPEVNNKTNKEAYRKDERDSALYILDKVSKVLTDVTMAVTGFELINCNFIPALLNYLMPKDVIKAKPRQEAFSILFFTHAEGHNHNVNIDDRSLADDDTKPLPAVALLRKLQILFKKLEKFPVIVHEVSSTTRGGSTFSRQLRVLARPMRLRLQCMPGQEKQLKNTTCVIMAEPLASIQSIEDFLWPIVRIPTPSDTDSTITVIGEDVEIPNDNEDTHVKIKNQSNRRKHARLASKKGEMAKDSVEEKSTTDLSAIVRLHDKDTSNQVDAISPQPVGNKGKKRKIEEVENDKDNESKCKTKVSKRKNTGNKGPDKLQKHEPIESISKGSEGEGEGEGDDVDVQDSAEGQWDWLEGTSDMEEDDPVLLDSLRAGWLKMESGMMNDDDCLSDRSGSLEEFERAMREMEEDDEDEEMDEIDYDDDDLGHINMTWHDMGPMDDMDDEDESETEPIRSKEIRKKTIEGKSQVKQSVELPKSESKGDSIGHALETPGHSRFNFSTDLSGEGNIDDKGRIISRYTKDPELQFYCNGVAVDRGMTILHVLEKYGSPSQGNSQGFEARRSSQLCQSTHVLQFERKITNKKPALPTKETNTQQHGITLTGMDENDPVLAILRLISLIHSLGLAQSVNKIELPANEFINTKLNAKLTRQLQDPLGIASCGLADWCNELIIACPFLFPFETRKRHLQLTCFGTARALTLLQSMQSGEKDNTTDREEVRLARLQRSKIKIDRNNLLDYWRKIMEQHAHTSAVIEIEYQDEVGTGLGPTLEFYALASKKLQQRDLLLWRDCYVGQDNLDLDRNQYIQSVHGLYPAPLPDSSVEAIDKIILYYNMLGRFIA